MSKEKAQDDVLRVEGASTAPKPSVLAGQLATGTIDPKAYGGYEDAAVEGNSLEALRALAQELIGCARGLAEAEAGVVSAREKLADVQERRLPTLMEKHSLKKFDFVDKTTGATRQIALIEGWRVSLPAKQGKTMDPQWRTKHDAIYDWLGEIGSAGIIKKELVAALGLMPDATVAAIVAAFKKENPEVDMAFNKFVEPMSLKALVTKRKDAGVEVHEFINAKPMFEARVKGSA